MKDLIFLALIFPNNIFLHFLLFIFFHTKNYPPFYDSFKRTVFYVLATVRLFAFRMCVCNDRVIVDSKTRLE